MKKSLVILFVITMTCTVLLTTSSVYAEATDEYTRLMFYSDNLGNFFVSYAEENLTNVTARNMGIWQFIQIDYDSTRYIFFRNTKSGYLQLWRVSNRGISRLYGGKLSPVQQSAYR
jgi:hypothetical protein